MEVAKEDKENGKNIDFNENEKKRYTMCLLPCQLEQINKTIWLKNRNLFSHNSGDQKSEISITEPKSRGESVLCLFKLW